MGVEYAPTEEGQLWNNITQSNAANVCRDMYDSNYGATSDLVNSYAWDTAILFIQTYSDDSNYSGQNSLNTILANTGTNGDERCHIHDMASNCEEWTTETSSSVSSPCVVRGDYYNNISRYNTSWRGGITPAGSRVVAFRPLLYL